jgi:GTP-binding protein
VKEADLIAFVVDARAGATALDLEIAGILRRANKPVVLVANKVDDRAQELALADLYTLGFGDPVGVSAEHGRGVAEMLEALRDRTPAPSAPRGGGRPVAIAVIGRPNVGKSSLVNAMTGTERVLVHDQPGTTRDAVDTPFTYEGRPYVLVDTAGIRRKVRNATGPEYYGLVRSLRAVDEADVVVIVIDAKEGPTEQDQKIAERVADAGRAAIIVLNKWDLIDEESRSFLERDVEEKLRFVPWAPVLRTSALTGRGLDRILPAVRKVREAWDQRVPTAQLNAWLREVEGRIPLGGRGPRPTKIRYATMARTRPPEVVLFSTGSVSDQASRALERRLRERFGFEGTPIRIVVRQRAKRAAQGR